MAGVLGRKVVKAGKMIVARGIACTLAAVAFAALPAKAEIIRGTDLLRGVSIPQGQCGLGGAQAVWISAYNQGFCIRYYLSNAGGAQGKPVVFLQGDQLGRLDLRSGEFEPDADLKDTDTTKLQRMADNISAAAKAPAIYLARPGVDGSSGHHRIRRTVLELHAINEALDAIRHRHGFEGFHLVGQSGGSGLIGGLLALRGDIACAVPGAGRLSLLRKVQSGSDPGREFFDPMDAIGMIAANRAARIIVVTDPQDRVVGVQHQSSFVNALRREGRAVEQYFVQATDAKNHGVLAYAGRAVVLCAQNAPGTRIATELDLLSKKRIAAAHQGARPVQPGGPPSVSGGAYPSRMAPVQPLPRPSSAPLPRPTQWPQLSRNGGANLIR